MAPTSGNKPMLLLTIPGSDKDDDGKLLANPPHLVGKADTYIGLLRQRDFENDNPTPIVKPGLPAFPEGTTTKIVVGPQKGFVKLFEFDRKLLVESSDFFAAIYGKNGQLCEEDQTIRCYDIPVKVMDVIEKWLLNEKRHCEFDNRPKRTERGVHILYVWRTADYLQMNGIANAAIDIYHNIIRSENNRTVNVQEFDFMYRYNLQFKPLFSWMLDSITFDYNNMRLPTIYYSDVGQAFNFADDAELVPENVGQIIQKYPQIAPAMLYTARRQKYLGYDISTDPMNDTWDGTRGDSKFCRGHHDHLLDACCMAPETAPEVANWDTDESEVDADGDFELGDMA